MGQWVTLNVNTYTKQPDRVAWFAYDWKPTKADKDLMSLTTSFGSNVRGQKSAREDLQRGTMALLTQESQSVWRVSIRILGIKISGFEQTYADKVDTLADACPNLGSAKMRAVDEMKRLGYLNDRGLWTGDPPVRWYIDGNVVILKESEIQARFNKSSEDFLAEIKQKKRDQVLTWGGLEGMTEKEKAVELERRASQVKAKPKNGRNFSDWQRDSEQERWRRVGKTKQQMEERANREALGDVARPQELDDYWPDVMAEEEETLSSRSLETMAIKVKPLTERIAADDFIWQGDTCYRIRYEASVGSIYVVVYRQWVARRQGLAIFPRRDAQVEELAGATGKRSNVTLTDCQPLSRTVKRGELVGTGAGTFRAAANHGRGVTLILVENDVEPNLRGLSIQDRQAMEDRLRADGRQRMTEEEVRWWRSRYRLDVPDVWIALKEKPEDSFIISRRAADAAVEKIKEEERRVANLESLRRANARPSDTREPLKTLTPSPELIEYELTRLPAEQQREIVERVLIGQGFTQAQISRTLMAVFGSDGDGEPVIIPERYLAGHDDEDAV